MKKLDIIIYAATGMLVLYLSYLFMVFCVDAFNSEVDTALKITFAAAIAAGAITALIGFLTLYSTHEAHRVQQQQVEFMQKLHKNELKKALIPHLQVIFDMMTAYSFLLETASQVPGIFIENLTKQSDKCLEAIDFVKNSDLSLVGINPKAHKTLVTSIDSFRIIPILCNACKKVDEGTDEDKVKIQTILLANCQLTITDINNSMIGVSLIMFDMRGHV